jgi:mannose-1-phosphate guanylyltransferase
MGALHAVIMAGGAGTRFWPASRQTRPKQFLPLANGKVLLQATVERLAGLCPPERTWIVTNPRQQRSLKKFLPAFPPEQVIVEPEPRDTAPCVALATAVIAARDPEATIAMLPADHVIEPTPAFQALLRRGSALAEAHGALVVFGVQPTSPATGYGYIECGEDLDSGQPRAQRVRRFREKPDRATAEQFVASGNFLWNSGIFVWTAAAITAAMAADAGLAKAGDGMLAAARTGNKAALTRAFKRAPKTSIDYAVMEHAANVVVVRAAVRWDDVGAFPALADVVPRDAHGNAALLTGGSACVPLQSSGNVVYADGKRTVALFGVDDLVVVAVDDAVLVCRKDNAGDLKLLVEQLKAQGRQDLL